MAIATDRSPAPLFLMLGDSLVAEFDWQRLIPKYTIRNYGVPGATTADLLSSLPGLKPHFGQAKLIMIMIGTNDLANEYYGLLKELKKVLIFLHRHFPGAEILTTSILPIRLPHVGQGSIVKLNGLIKELSRSTGSTYVDVHSRFCQAANGLFQADGVHLTPEGYELWARTLLEHIAFMLEND